MSEHSGAGRYASRCDVAGELQQIIAIAALKENRGKALRRIASNLDTGLSPEEAWLLSRVARTDTAVTARELEGTDARSIATVAKCLIARGLMRDKSQGRLCTDAGQSGSIRKDGSPFSLRIDGNRRPLASGRS